MIHLKRLAMSMASRYGLVEPGMGEAEMEPADGCLDELIVQKRRKMDTSP